MIKELNSLETKCKYHQKPIRDHLPWELIEDKTKHYRRIAV